MEKLPYRFFHTVSLLEHYAKENMPLDLFVSLYFRRHKALGSKDRAEIADTVYGVIRWLGLLRYLIGESAPWREVAAAYTSTNPADYRHVDTLPAHIRVSFPENLHSLLVDSLGAVRAEAFCWVSNTPAPTTIRVNLLKTSREELLRRWNGTYDISPCTQSASGIIFHKKIHFFSLPEFKEGLFEVQDEGSQLLAALVAPSPGDLVMDYCAGSGGKALAIAPSMHHKGQLYLHDVRKRALLEAKKRLKRAGIQNGQIVPPNADHLKRLKKKMDWVLVDVPCSGTGTLRRNPDMKWRFDAAILPRLVGEQRTIFERALSFVKPGGHIVYGTCSVLDIENGAQTRHFTSTYPLKLAKEPLQTFPTFGGMDGFYGATFH